MDGDSGMTSDITTGISDGSTSYTDSYANAQDTQSRTSPRRRLSALTKSIMLPEMMFDKNHIKQRIGLRNEYASNPIVQAIINIGLLAGIVGAIVSLVFLFNPDPKKEKPAKAVFLVAQLMTNCTMVYIWFRVLKHTIVEKWRESHPRKTN